MHESHGKPTHQALLRNAGVREEPTGALAKGSTNISLSPRAHLSNSGFSPQSKESCRSLTRLAWPGIRKSPSSLSPRSRMKSTHCSTSRGASRGPNFRSWCTVSSSRCPKIPGHRKGLFILTWHSAQWWVKGVWDNERQRMLCVRQRRLFPRKQIGHWEGTARWLVRAVRAAVGVAYGTCPSQEKRALGSMCVNSIDG